MSEEEIVDSIAEEIVNPVEGLEPEMLKTEEEAKEDFVPEEPEEGMSVERVDDEGEV